MDTQKSLKTIDILLCEDNPGDVYLIENALQEIATPHFFYHVADGEEALNYLHQRGLYANVSHPDLLLLDLNLPKKNGFEVLEEMQADSTLKLIPTIILTSSEAEQDIVKSYQLCANCFVTKPFNVRDFSQSVKSLGQFWLQQAALPPNSYTNFA